MDENLPAVLENEQAIQLVKQTLAANLTDGEFGIFVHLARTYGLDPFRREIWAVKFGDKPAHMFTGRDGFLAIAHRSGQFDGMESGVKEEAGRVIGWARVHRKDMSHAFYVEVSLEEYQKDTEIWRKMPRTMIQKVAESQALRRAFSAHGLFAPEEFPETEKPPMRDVTPEKKEDRPPLSSPISRSSEPQGERDYIPTTGKIIDADKTQAEREMSEAERDRAATIDRIIKGKGKGKK